MKAPLYDGFTSIFLMTNLIICSPQKKHSEATISVISEMIWSRLLSPVESVDTVSCRRVISCNFFCEHGMKSLISETHFELKNSCLIVCQKNSSWAAQKGNDFFRETTSVEKMTTIEDVEAFREQWPLT